MNTISNVAISADGIKSAFFVNDFINFDTSFDCDMFWDERLKIVQNGLPKNKLKLAIEYINQHLDEEIKILDISDYLGVSQYHFGRLFKRSMGMTVHTYLVQQRVRRAQQLLQETELTILDISNECGFANPSHFAKHFRKYASITPREFRMSLSLNTLHYPTPAL